MTSFDKRHISRLALAVALVVVAAALAKEPQDRVAQMETIKRDIAAGEQLEFKRSVEILGSVGPRARIVVKNGGVRIKGDVGDDAVVEAHDGGTTSVFHGGNVSMSSNSRVVVVINGKVVVDDKGSGSKATEGDSDLAGIEVEGAVGHRVSLTTDGTIEVGGQVESSSKLQADGAIVLSGKVAEGASLDSGGGIVAQALGDDVKAVAGGSIQGFDIGKRAALSAGGSITVHDVSMGAKLRAGGSVTAGEIASGTKVEAGGSIVARTARQEDLSAGGSVVLGN
jgi:hypothetical protein